MASNVGNVIIEYGQHRGSTKQIEDRVKEIWKGQGQKVKDILSLNVYFRSEEGMCYYVINDDSEGSFSIEDLEVQ